jgi:GT2 family glycosyltransferase
MKYSFIIGVYNHRPHLERLIQSLESQTLQDFEVHFCDDRSNDGSFSFLAQVASYKPNWHLHRLGPLKWRPRLARSLNQGVKRALGDYCVFIMGDSFPELNYLEQADQLANPDKVLCGVRMQVKDNEVIDVDWRLKKELIPPVAVLLPREPYNLVTGNGLVVPTEALRKYGLWDERFSQGGEDTELVARLYYRGYLVYSVPQMVLYHNYHKSTDAIEPNKLAERLVWQYAR